MTTAFKPKRPRDMRYQKPLFCLDCGDAGVYFSAFDDQSVCANCGTIHLVQSGTLIRVDEYFVWMSSDTCEIGGSC